MAPLCRRLCVDFMDVNKAFPKDPFPLPRIDQIMDATPMFPGRLLGVSSDKDEGI
jgi:hypothetical protein